MRGKLVNHILADHALRPRVARFERAPQLARRVGGGWRERGAREVGIAVAAHKGARVGRADDVADHRTGARVEDKGTSGGKEEVGDGVEVWDEFEGGGVGGVGGGFALDGVSQDHMNRDINS